MDLDRRMQRSALPGTTAQPAMAPGKRTLAEGIAGSPPEAAATAAGGAAPLAAAPGARPGLHALFGRRGGGSPLPVATLAYMERAFATSFASVRTHEGPEAAAVGAAAYTLGEDIYFAPGRFDPASAGGRSLLGHELAHVVQQRSGRVSGAPASDDGPSIHMDSGLEREADEAGARVARGMPAALRGGSGPGGGSSGAGAIQRQLEHRPFGDFWVGDEQPAGELAQHVERISGEAFGALSELWAQITNGNSGALEISEADDKQQQHGGFRAMVIDALARLLSRGRGRRLVGELAGGGRRVRIQPLSAGQENHAIQDGDLSRGMRVDDQTPGVKCDVLVQIDPALTDATSRAFDADYNVLANPVFITLGHELIHARHLTLGIGAPREDQPRISAKYDELEEEETIATGNPLDHHGPTENGLRDEHGLPARFGHGGVNDLELHRVKLSPESRTLAAIAQLGGVGLPQLFTDNPNLASELLSADPGLARALVESGDHEEFRGELMNTSVEALAEQLEDLRVFTRTVAPLLRDHVAALPMIVPDANMTLMELLSDASWIQDTLVNGGFGEQVGPRIGDNARAVLTEIPAALQAIIDHEDCLEQLHRNDELRAQIAQDPNVTLGLALHHAGGEGIMAQTAKTAVEVLNAHPAVGAIACDRRAFQFAGCVNHHVRRADGDLQDKPQILGEYTVRGDEMLLGTLNPGVNWNGLQLGQVVVVPVTPG